MSYPGLLRQSSCPCSSPLPTHTSTGDTQTQFCLSLCGVSGSWCAQGLFEPSERLWHWVLILNVISSLLPSCWGFSFALGHGVSPQSRSSTTPNSKLTTLFQVYYFNWNCCDPCCLTYTTFCRSSIRSIPEKLEPAAKCHGNSIGGKVDSEKEEFSKLEP